MDKVSLIRLIKEAFKDVSRGDGITLHQAMALDDYLSEKEVIQARTKDTEKSWEDIELSSIAEMPSALSFLDEKGFRYYIPVYMIASLHDHIDVNPPFYHLTQLFPLSMRKTTPEMIIEKYKFNSLQAKAIASFLKYIIESSVSYQAKADLMAVEKWMKYIA